MQPDRGPAAAGQRMTCWRVVEGTPRQYEPCTVANLAVRRALIEQRLKSGRLPDGQGTLSKTKTDDVRSTRATGIS